MELDLYDVSGRFVTGIAGGDYPAGYHTVKWDADGLEIAVPPIADLLVQTLYSAPGGGLAS